jgi:hypothetical protein
VGHNQYGNEESTEIPQAATQDSFVLTDAQAIVTMGNKLREGLEASSVPQRSNEDLIASILEDTKNRMLDHLDIDANQDISQEASDIWNNVETNMSKRDQEHIRQKMYNLILVASNQSQARVVDFEEKKVDMQRFITCFNRNVNVLSTWDNRVEQFSSAIKSRFTDQN